MTSRMHQAPEPIHRPSLPWRAVLVDLVRSPLRVEWAQSELEFHSGSHHRTAPFVSIRKEGSRSPSSVALPPARIVSALLGEIGVVEMGDWVWVWKARVP